MLPAVGQGALGIETRENDGPTRQAAAALDDEASHQAALAERQLLASLRAGCLAPVGAWARLESGKLLLEAVVLSSDGTRRLAASGQGDPHAAQALGREVAESLLQQGAADLIAASRSGN